MKIATLGRLIYLTRTKAESCYTVVASEMDGCRDIMVPTASIGHAIVRALRTHADKRLASHKPEDVFSIAVLREKFPRQFPSPPPLRWETGWMPHHRYSGADGA